MEGKMKLYKNKEWMEEKYLIEQLDMCTIANLANCGPRTIKRWLQIFEIPVRTQAETMRIIFGKKHCDGIDKPLYEDEEWLKQQYLERELSMKEIAKIVGCTGPLIRRRLDEFGIERRSLSERTKLLWDKQFEDLSGKRFEKLTVLEHMGVDKHHQRLWKCKCDCGNVAIRKGSEIKRGHTKSCGCMKYPSRMPAGEAAFNKLLYRYKENAKSRGYEFELSRDQFRELTKESCYYCGTLPTQLFSSGGHGAYTYNGIDRLDNGKDYIIDNVVPCCKQCNYAKMGSSPQEFADWITRVYNHWVVPKNEIDL